VELPPADAAEAFEPPRGSAAPALGAEASALAALARAIGAEIVVALPAGLDAEEAAELAAGFVALGARLLLPTRLDGTARLGGVLAAAEVGLALTEAGTGRSPAAGLERLDAAWLAARLLAGAQPYPEMRA
jgi:flagellar biosynthesis protein FlhF